KDETETRLGADAAQPIARGSGGVECECGKLEVGDGKVHPVGQFVERMQEVLVALATEAEQAAKRLDADKVDPHILQQDFARLVETAGGGEENGICDGGVIEFERLEPLRIESGIDGHAGPYIRAVGVPQEALDRAVDKTVHGPPFTRKRYAKGGKETPSRYNCSEVGGRTAFFLATRHGGAKLLPHGVVHRRRLELREDRLGDPVRTLGGPERT